jgi:rhamnogalacturonyl hydrolase YesR
LKSKSELELRIQKSMEQLALWVERHDYKAYDPGDGQMSPLRQLAFGSFFLKRSLTAAVLRTPFNIRPLMGIQPHTSTKGMGYMAWGYTKLYASAGDNRHAERARFCLDWLIQHREPGHKHFCWGNHFDFTTRGGTIPAHEPTIVWSSLIGQSFLEAYHALGDAKYLEVAASVADWILTLPREQTTSGACLSYVGFKQSSIHNSNMLGAALLAKVGSVTKRAEASAVAKSAMQYSCSRLNNDGSWFYGEDPKYHWIDNFHTAYNLDSLKRYQESTGDREYADQLKTGFDYFKKTFFEIDGRSRYYHDRVFPTDIQCAAQAVDTLSFFSDADDQSLALAQKIAFWTIEHMQDPDGHFYYRDLDWKMIKTPMLHWGQGTMFKALAHLSSVQQKKRASAPAENSHKVNVETISS